jgi:hypothetical protein
VRSLYKLVARFLGAQQGIGDGSVLDRLYGAPRAPQELPEAREAWQLPGPAGAHSAPVTWYPENVEALKRIPRVSRRRRQNP